MGETSVLGRAFVALTISALSAAVLTVVGPPATAADDAQCLSAPTVAPSPTKILTIGDSLTSAAAGDYTWRYFLWKNLVTNGGTTPSPASTPYQLVGPYTNLVDPVSLVRGSTDYRCVDFDKANGGIPGSLLIDYLAPSDATTVVQKMVSDSSAGVVVVFAGINDLTGSQSRGIAALSADQLLAKDSDLVTKIRATNPSAKILFLTVPTSDGVAPSGSVLEKARAYNNALPAAAATWSTVASPVGAVTTAQHWGHSDLTYDAIHPNPQGEATIGADVADGLEALGVGAGAQRPLPDLSGSVGPAAPAVLAQATPVGSTVTLSWTLPVGAIAGQVLRKDYTAATGWQTLGSPVVLTGVGSGKPYAETYSDTTYVPGHVVRYRVVAAKGTIATYALTSTVQFSTKVTSNEITVPQGAALPPLAKVAGVAATPGVHAVTLNWAATPGADGYVITMKRGSTSYGYLSTTTTLTVPKLVAGQSYGFTVSARSVEGQSSGTDSATVVAKPRAYPLARPTLTLKKSGKRFKVGWPAVAHAGVYEVQYKAPGRTTWLVVKRSTSRGWTSFSTKKGKKYQVRVRAYDGFVAGPFSLTGVYKAK